MWYLYLIRCREQSLYTGITTDPDRRFNEHQNSPKGARYLRGKGPLTLVFTAPVGTRSQALKLERQIKRWPKVKKEALVSGALDLGA